MEFLRCSLWNLSTAGRNIPGKVQQILHFQPHKLRICTPRAALSQPSWIWSKLWNNLICCKTIFLQKDTVLSLHLKIKKRGLGRQLQTPLRLEAPFNMLNLKNSGQVSLEGEKKLSKKYCYKKFKDENVWIYG